MQEVTQDLCVFGGSSKNEGDRVAANDELTENSVASLGFSGALQWDPAVCPVPSLLWFTLQRSQQAAVMNQLYLQTGDRHS